MPAETFEVGHLVETSLYVADLSRARAFYERLLGRAPTYLDARMAAFALPGASVLLLFERGPCEAPGRTAPAHGASGAQHLCFAIETDRLAGWPDHLAALGLSIERRVTWPRGGTSLYVRDPDGHSVEFATRGLWPDW